MTERNSLTRRQFLKTTVAGGMGGAIVWAGRGAANFQGATTQVTVVDEVPTFLRGGNAILTPSFETYAPAPHYFRQFADAGTRIFGFSTNAAACDYGHSKATWIDADTWDYSQFEERAEAVLTAAPNALLLPRVNLGTPRWWLAQHPEVLERLDDGSTYPSGENPTLPKNRAFPSPASTVWRSAVGDALERFIQYVLESRFGPHVLGWFLSGMHTEEFYHWACSTERLAGYSVPTVAAFRQWLRDRYGDVSTLRKAWNQADVDFDNATVPTRQQRVDQGDGMFRGLDRRNVVDFYLFWNELIPETIDYFASVAKKASSGRHVVGAFYGYMYEFAGDPEFGHNALGRYLASPHLDFMAVTASYFTRQSGTGGDYARSPAASVRLHGKLWYHDNDAVSFLAKKRLEALGFADNSPDWTRDLGIQLQSLGYTDTAEKSGWMYRRGVGFALCNGMFQAWFDLHGGYFDDPQLMSQVGSLNNLAARAVSWDRSSIAEILVIADEASCAWCRPRSPLLRESLLTPQNQLIRIGAPVDHILLDDLALLDTDRYKLVIFLNCFQVTTAQRRLIERKLKRDDKHLLWCSAAGWFSDTGGSAARCRELTGFELIRDGRDSGSVDLHEGTARKRTGDVEQAYEVGVCENRDWTSLWTPTAAMPARDYRELARAAGVHIFSDRDDVFYANRSLICLHARSDGRRVLGFPANVELHDALTDELEASSGRQWRSDLRQGETRLLRWRVL